MAQTQMLMIGGGGATKASVEQFFEYMRSLTADYNQPAAIYQSVAWAYRCVQLRANAISSIPWQVVTLEGEREAEWPLNMERLWWQTEASLLLFGAAYWLKQRNRVRLSGLQFLNAQTMRVKTSPMMGIVGFEQSARRGGQRQFAPDEIVYFRTWNPNDDLGPGLAPAMVIGEAAGLMANANTWAANFFAHGAIPAVILSTEQNPPDAELERVRTVWNQLTEGVKRAWRTVVLRGGMKPTIVGAPVKDLAMTELTQTARQQIAIAFGVPESMVGDPASNYATAQSNRLSFWQDTIVPEATQLEAIVNEQLFEPMGLQFQFLTSQIEALQQDEAEKAEALTKLYEAGIITLEEARDQMGLGAMPMGERPQPPEPTTAEPAATEHPMLGPQKSGEALADLRRWRNKARKRGLCEFESNHIPPGMARAVKVLMESVGVEEAFAFLKAEPEGRAAAEERLREKIAATQRKYLDAAASAVMAGKDFDTSELAAELQGNLQAELSTLATEQALREAAAVGLDIDIAAVNTAALAWAREYSYDLVKGITDTTRALIGEVVARFVETPGMTMGDVYALLEPAFGEVRAKLIGITEITRAYSQGTLIYQELLRRYGLKMTRVWQTNADDRVCPICVGLHGETEKQWGTLFAGGPPAHPGCRCWLNLELI